MQSKVMGSKTSGLHTNAPHRTHLPFFLGKNLLFFLNRGSDLGPATKDLDVDLGFRPKDLPASLVGFMSTLRQMIHLFIVEHTREGTWAVYMELCPLQDMLSVFSTSG